MLPIHNELWTFAILDPGFSSYTECCNTLPTISLTDTLFSTGTDGAAAYRPAWYRETYNPPSYALCGTSDHYSVQQLQLPPPQVNPPILPAAATQTGG
jgi:hypothetical protein